MNGKQVISGREKIGIGGVGGDSEKAEVHAEVNEAKGDTRRGMTRMITPCIFPSLSKLLSSLLAGPHAIVIIYSKKAVH